MGLLKRYTQLTNHFSLYRCRNRTLGSRSATLPGFNGPLRARPWSIGQRQIMQPIWGERLKLGYIWTMQKVYKPVRVIERPR